MKHLFTLVLFVIILFSCKKDGTINPQNSTAYYFEATLSDGRKINDKASYPHSPNSEIFVSATVGHVGINARGGTKA